MRGLSDGHFTHWQYAKQQTLYLTGQLFLFPQRSWPTEDICSPPSICQNETNHTLCSHWRCEKTPRNGHRLVLHHAGNIVLIIGHWFSKGNSNTFNSMGNNKVRFVIFRSHNAYITYCYSRYEGTPQNGRRYSLRLRSRQYQLYSIAWTQFCTCNRKAN